MNKAGNKAGNKSGNKARTNCEVPAWINEVRKITKRVNKEVAKAEKVSAPKKKKRGRPKKTK